MTVQRFITNPGAAELPKTADVVIIGGGPAGTSALWALERAQPGIHAVLIEKTERLAAGSSTASLENFRTCWPTPCLMKQMSRSIHIYHHADEFLGEGAGAVLAVKTRGYLYVGFTETHARQLKQDVEHLHRMGLSHVEYLDSVEVEKRYPWLKGRVIAAKLDPMAGWLDSNALIYKYAQSTRTSTILLGISDTKINVENGRVTGVTTSVGDISAPHVIIAAGAHARAVGRTAGIELPIVARPRQNFTTPWRHPDYPEDGPCVISAPPAPHLRPEAREGAIIGWEFAWNNKHVKRADEPTVDYLVDPIDPEKLKDPRFPSIALMLLARQFRHEPGYGFGDSRYLRGIQHNIGYYVYRSPENTYTVDEQGRHHEYESQRAILGPYPHIKGLFLSIAHVGHGIMASAASGEIVAAHVLGQPLPDPQFADFGLDVHWVEYDGGGL